MPDLCLNLLTKITVPDAQNALDQIWSLDHWAASLDRVLDVKVEEATQTRQVFELRFDAGREVPDTVRVERFRKNGEIGVVHTTPPPGITALSAVWWSEPEHPGVIFAKRKINMRPNDYTPQIARHMFGLLKENLHRLVGTHECKAA
ncbi:MAG: hypothetical protein AB8B71_00095 [Paracoccaceae bacterium]